MPFAGMISGCLLNVIDLDAACGCWLQHQGKQLSVRCLSRRHANFSGTLPESWTNQLPVLSIFYGGFNALSGSLPSEWQAMNALTNFHAEGNNLTGTLPGECALLCA